MRFLLFVLPVALAAQVTPTTRPKAAATGKAAPSRAAAKPKPAAPAPMTDEQKTIYALGLSLYKSLGRFDLSPAEIEIVKKAITDSQAGKPAVDLQTWGPKINNLMTERGSRVAERQKIESKAYLAKAAAEPGAVKTDSGLIYRELRPGTGTSPAVTDTVKVNYRGTLPDGTEFDSSYSRHEPATFPLNGVIKCWTEGVQKMKVGGKAQLVCPSEIAYGEHGPPSIPPGATLVFEVELLDITPAAKP